MDPREAEDNTYANFGATNKEHYGMLWYFLGWSISCCVEDVNTRQRLSFSFPEFLYSLLEFNSRKI